MCIILMKFVKIRKSGFSENHCLLNLCFTLSDGDLALQGSLGSLSLSDLTPHGDLYRERFTTHGGEALVYDIHKYFSLFFCFLNHAYYVKVYIFCASMIKF